MDSESEKSAFLASPDEQHRDMDDFVARHMAQAQLTSYNDAKSDGEEEYAAAAAVPLATKSAMAVPGLRAARASAQQQQQQAVPLASGQDAKSAAFAAWAKAQQARQAPASPNMKQQPFLGDHMTEEEEEDWLDTGKPIVSGSALRALGDAPNDLEEWIDANEPKTADKSMGALRSFAFGDAPNDLEEWLDANEPKTTTSKSMAAPAAPTFFANSESQEAYEDWLLGGASDAAPQLGRPAPPMDRTGFESEALVDQVVRLVKDTATSSIATAAGAPHLGVTIPQGPALERQGWFGKQKDRLMGVGIMYPMSQFPDAVDVPEALRTVVSPVSPVASDIEDSLAITVNSTNFKKEAKFTVYRLPSSGNGSASAFATSIYTGLEAWNLTKSRLFKPGEDETAAIKFSFQHPLRLDMRPEVTFRPRDTLTPQLMREDVWAGKSTRENLVVVLHFDAKQVLKAVAIVARMQADTEVLTLFAEDRLSAPEKCLAQYLLTASASSSVLALDSSAAARPSTRGVDATTARIALAKTLAEFAAEHQHLSANVSVPSVPPTPLQTLMVQQYVSTLHGMARALERKGVSTLADVAQRRGAALAKYMRTRAAALDARQLLTAVANTYQLVHLQATGSVPSDAVARLDLLWKAPASLRSNSQKLMDSYLA